MIYIPNAALDPAYNQAFEACAFELLLREDVFLVWRNRCAVVCGRYQNIFQETYLPAAAACGAALIRRMTGGGCVYHDLGNVNYTWITSARDGAREAIANRMIGALRGMGIPAEPMHSGGIAVEGRKVSGSACRVANGRLLQHGTLLVDADLGLLRRLANGHGERYQSRAIRSEPAPVGNLGGWLGGMAAEEFAARLVKALAPDALLEPDPAFLSRARTLADARYRNWEWTFGNSPKFSFEKAFCWDGRPARLEYAAERGVIRQISIDCAERERLERALLDARLDLSGLDARLSGILGARSREFIENMF